MVEPVNTVVAVPLLVFCAACKAKAPPVVPMDTEPAQMMFVYAELSATMLDPSVVWVVTEFKVVPL